MASAIPRNLTKPFDGAARPALRELSLEVRDGEFLVLLGPSGCGKTTALRCVAGLDEATEGEIHIGERDVTRLPPAQRDVAMVFQNYALYPHLTVRENIAFALEVRRGAPHENLPPGGGKENGRGHPFNPITSQNPNPPSSFKKK